MRSYKMYYEQLGMLGDWWLYDWITDDEYAILSEKLLRKWNDFDRGGVDGELIKYLNLPGGESS